MPVFSYADAACRLPLPHVALRSAAWTQFPHPSEATHKLVAVIIAAALEHLAGECVNGGLESAIHVRNRSATGGAKAAASRATEDMHTLIRALKTDLSCMSVRLERLEALLSA